MARRHLSERDTLDEYEGAVDRVATAVGDVEAAEHPATLAQPVRLERVLVDDQPVRQHDLADRDGRSDGRLRFADDTARRGSRGPRAEVVLRGDTDANRVADVRRREDVGLAGRSADVGAVAAALVATPPLVGERDRLATRPRAGVRGQRLALLRRARNRR